MPEPEPVTVGYEIRETRQMTVYPTSSYSAAEIVAGLNSGKFWIRPPRMGGAVIMEGGVGEAQVVAEIGVDEALTGTDYNRRRDFKIN